MMGDLVEDDDETQIERNLVEAQDHLQEARRECSDGAICANFIVLALDAIDYAMRSIAEEGS